MVVNLLLGFEKVSVLRQGWSVLKDSNSAASLNALDLNSDSKYLRPGPFASFLIAHSSLND